MSEDTSRLVRPIGAGAVLFLAGIVWDLQWHLRHEEFEGTSQQFAAHWLLWIGALALLASAGLAFVRAPSRRGTRGLALILGAGAVYVPVSIWHFIAHANGVDPGLAHVLLGVCDLAMLAGAAWTLAELTGARLPRRPPTGSVRRKPPSTR